MLGLLEKDLRLTLTRKQTLLVFLIMALVMGISMDGSFLISYLTLLAAIVAVGTISYDEYDNGFAFLMTLPFSRKTYVREKYLFSLIFTAAAWCFGLILYCISGVIRHEAVSLADELPMLISLIPILYLSVAIMIPLQLKYGAEKSRIAMAVLFGIIAILIFASGKFLGDSDIAAGLGKALSAMSPAAILGAVTAVCVIVSIISYLLSIRIMERKEF